MDFIISLFALIVSISSLIVACRKYKQTRRIHISSLESEFYKEIFMKYLMVEIPKTRNYIRFTNDDKLDKGYKKLINHILDMKKGILYFYYRDKDFYSSVNDQLIELDEIIVEMAGKENIHFTERKKFLGDIDVRIDELYKTIFTNYFKV